MVSEIILSSADALLAMGILTVLLAISVILVFIFVAAIYVYFSLAWMTIARKLKYKRSWLAWIPIANIAMMLQLGKFHWAWVFLIFVPVFGWIGLMILTVIATWRIFEKRNYPGWLSLSMVVPGIGGIIYFIVIGFVAFGDRRKRF